MRVSRRFSSHILQVTLRDAERAMDDVGANAVISPDVRRDAPLARRASRRLVRRLTAMVVLVVLGAWLLAGFTRAARLGQQAFAPPDALQVNDLETTAIPVVPPFFLAHARGVAVEGQRFSTVYAQYFLVEPLSGLTIPLSEPCAIHAVPRPACASWELIAARPVTYWVVDAHTLGVAIWEVREAPCSIARTEESSTRVQIFAECRLPFSLNPSTGELKKTDLEVRLALPIGDRRVIDGLGHFADRCATLNCR